MLYSKTNSSTFGCKYMFKKTWLFPVINLLNVFVKYWLKNDKRCSENLHSGLIYIRQEFRWDRFDIKKIRMLIWGSPNILLNYVRILKDMGVFALCALSPIDVWKNIRPLFFPRGRHCQCCTYAKGSCISILQTQILATGNCWSLYMTLSGNTCF